MERVSIADVLNVVAASAGISLGDVARELSVDENKILDAWSEALSRELLEVARSHDVHEAGEIRWRLTALGLAAVQRDSASSR